MTTETRDFPTFVAERFGGVLARGSHSPDGAACYQEAANAYLGRKWSATEIDGAPSFVALNDAPWSSETARTNAMLPLHVITFGWKDWTLTRRRKWAKAVARETIRQILPPTLRALAERVPSVAPDLIAAALRCETKPNESAGAAAVSAAESAASASAAWSAAAAAWSAAESAASASAAWSAAVSAAESAAAESAESAESAAWSAGESAQDIPLQTLCAIMVEAAK